MCGQLTWMYLASYIRTLYRGHGHLQGHVFPRGLEIHIHIIIITSRARIDVYFLFYVEELHCDLNYHDQVMVTQVTMQFLNLKKKMFKEFTVIWYQVLLSNTKKLHIVIWFQAFLSKTNNSMVSSEYFYLIIIIFLHTVIWFQVRYFLSAHFFYQVILMPHLCFRALEIFGIRWKYLV